MKRNSVRAGLAVAALTGLLYSCTPGEAKKPEKERTTDVLGEAKAAIAKSNAVYFDSFSKGDSSIFIDRYAADCCIMPPGTPALCGPNAALDFFRVAYHDIHLRGGKFITTAVYGDGIDYVTEEGLWQSFDAENKLFDDGKFLVLWKKTPRGWKMFRDSFSSNRK